MVRPAQAVKPSGGVGSAAASIARAWRRGGGISSVTPAPSATTQTLFCGDLFTQGGRGEVALTQGDILGPSEGFRRALDHCAHAPQTDAVLRKLAAQHPRTLACTHGGAWQGDGGMLLRHLAEALGAH